MTPFVSSKTTHLMDIITAENSADGSQVIMPTEYPSWLLPSFWDSKGITSVKMSQDQTKRMWSIFCFSIHAEHLTRRCESVSRY